jgi:hypothetical protein
MPEFRLRRNRPRSPQAVKRPPTFSQISRPMSIRRPAVRLIHGGRDHESHLAKLHATVEAGRSEPRPSLRRLPEARALATCIAIRKVPFWRRSPWPAYFPAAPPADDSRHRTLPQQPSQQSLDAHGSGRFNCLSAKKIAPPRGAGLLDERKPLRINGQRRRIPARDSSKFPADRCAAR